MRYCVLSWARGRTEMSKERCKCRCTISVRPPHIDNRYPEMSCLTVKERCWPLIEVKERSLPNNATKQMRGGRATPTKTAV
jgi:hypothetical protein